MGDIEHSDDYRRHLAIQKAVEAANRIIMDAGDGSQEETNYLTAEVARKLLEYSHMPFSSAIMRYDMQKGKSGE